MGVILAKLAANKMAALAAASICVCPPLAYKAGQKPAVREYVAKKLDRAAKRIPRARAAPIVVSDRTAEVAPCPPALGLGAGGPGLGEGGFDQVGPVPLPPAAGGGSAGGPYPPGYYDGPGGGGSGGGHNPPPGGPGGPSGPPGGPGGPVSPPTTSPAPEPTAWALMLIGFGALGTAMRWRKTRAA